jgi:hypothetical protein
MDKRPAQVAGIHPIHGTGRGMDKAIPSSRDTMKPRYHEYYARMRRIFIYNASSDTSDTRLGYAEFIQILSQLGNIVTWPA